MLALHFAVLMEMCIGDQQYVTLLFYLDDICVFAENADDMLDRVELVFQRLKSFNLKVKPKKSFYFQDEVNFLGHILSAKGMSPNPEKVEKVKNWPIPTNPKEVHFFCRSCLVLSAVYTKLRQMGRTTTRSHYTSQHHR